MVKDILYTSFGGMMIVKEKIEQELQKLEEKGKLSKEDAKTFLDSLQKKGEESEAEFKEKIKEALKEVIDELGLATKEDIENLKKQ
jgi:polyhydroxyalkanoate synthesis regulator phasin